MGVVKRNLFGANVVQPPAGDGNPETGLTIRHPTAWRPRAAIVVLAGRRAAKRMCRRTKKRGQLSVVAHIAESDPELLCRPTLTGSALPARSQATATCNRPG